MRLFIRGLFLFALLKVVLYASLVPDVLAGSGFATPSNPLAWVLFLPLQLTGIDVWVFLAAVIIVLLTCLVLRPNYITGLVLCFIVFNVFRFALPVVNGSDYVLIVLSLWALALPLYPQAKGEKVRIVQQTASNVAVVMIRLQVVLIYWVSGIDKLLSNVWRSGDAFWYVWNLEFMINPGFAHVGSPGLNLFLSWITIVFELAFCVLVWFRPTRLTVLALGVLFHLGIGFMLNLPDFMLIMILPYLCFLTDADYDRLRKVFIRWPR